MGIDRREKPARETATQALLNWGFRFFESHRLYEADKQIARQKVWKGASRGSAAGRGRAAAGEHCRAAATRS